MSAYKISKVDNRKTKLTVEMESHLLNATDTISILDFLQTFKRACKSLLVNDGATIILFENLIQERVKQDLLHFIKGGSKDGTEDDE